MNIENELRDIIYMKVGNKELSIFFNCGEWEIHLGNPSGCVRLGEVEGEIVVESKTLPGAIKLMKKKVGL